MMQMMGAIFANQEQQRLTNAWVTNPITNLASSGCAIEVAPTPQPIITLPPALVQLVGGAANPSVHPGAAVRFGRNRGAGIRSPCGRGGWRLHAQPTEHRLTAMLLLPTFASARGPPSTTGPCASTLENSQPSQEQLTSNGARQDRPLPLPSS